MIDRTHDTLRGVGRVAERMSQPAEGGDADPPSEGLAPAEAFALLGDDARIAILRALWEREAETPVPFSELYDAVDIDDSAPGSTTTSSG